MGREHVRNTTCVVLASSLLIYLGAQSSFVNAFGWFPEFVEQLCEGPTCDLSKKEEAEGPLAWEVASMVAEQVGDKINHRHLQRSINPPTTTTTSTLPPMAGKYPTKILSVAKPSEADRKRCKFTVTASEITNGKRSILKGGSTEVFTQPNDEIIYIKAMSEDQRPPSTSFWGRLWRRFKSIFSSGKEYYDYYFQLPPHCGRVHYDPAGVAAEVREGRDVKAVVFRTSPEITAYYAPSTDRATFPFDISKVGENRFQQLRKCLYGVRITKDFAPDSLVFSSSQRIASVTAKDKSGASVTLASQGIHCDCRPSKLGHISWWLMRNSFGNPIVLLYFGYGQSLGHPPCLRRTMRQGTPAELDSWVNYEGFWAY